MASAVRLAAAVKRRDVSPVELARHYLAVCDRRNAGLNALIWRRDAELLAEAAQAEAAVMRGDDLPPFHGVPIPIKDLTEVAGEPVTHGSVAFKTKVGRVDSASVASLRRAGFLFMGRSNAPEFGTLPVTENTLYGATRNPWNTERTAGGSSGGAAAAVAAGMAPIAHASDGGGSIRIPAACCGLVGLKATRGRIPKGPWVSEVMHGFSTDGCVSKTVEDTAALLDVLGRFDPTNWYGVQPPVTPFLAAARTAPARLRIGFTTRGPLAVEPSQTVVDGVTRAATVLSALGHRVEDVAVDWGISSEQLAADFVAVWCTGPAYLELADWTGVEPLNQGLRALGIAQSSVDYIKATVRLQVFSRRLVSAWGRQFDLLLTPTLAMDPPPIGWIFASGETDPLRLLWRCTEMVPYTGWCNVTGQPAISLPAGIGAAGLPVGVQLIAAPYREDWLLAVAAEMERELQWAQHLPC